MRILMLAPSPNVKGPLNKHTPYLVNALQKLGCEISVESWGRHKEQETYFEKGIGRYKDILHTRKTLKYGSVDMLVIKTSHGWGTLSRDILLLVATRHLCPHIVLQFHGSSSEMLVAPGNFLFKFFSHWLVRLCDAALVLSSEEQREWQQFYPHGRFHMVSNPFVPDTHEISNIDQEIHDAKKGPVILFVGRLIREKGIFDLLDAISLLQKKWRFHLLVVGNGSDAGAVKEKIAYLGLTDCVTMAGYLKGKDLNNAYCNADVLVLPTYWIEGFPTVITEAMSFGLPIVTTRIRGAADHLLERVNTMFVQSKDPVALANTILALFEDPDLRARMGQANREKVKDFSPDVVAKHYLNVLKKVSGDRSEK